MLGFYVRQGCIRMRRAVCSLGSQVLFSSFRCMDPVAALDAGVAGLVQHAVICNDGLSTGWHCRTPNPALP